MPAQLTVGKGRRCSSYEAFLRLTRWVIIALVVLRISPFWEHAIQGALIVAAVALDTLLARSMAKRMMRKRDHD